MAGYCFVQAFLASCFEESRAVRSLPVDTHVKMKEIPKQDRPYEKCVLKGPGMLTDAELLAVIIRTGSKDSSALGLAQKVLELTYPGDEGLVGLCRLSLSDFQKLPGIGPVKGIQLQCIGELSKRISRRAATVRNTTFENPQSVAEYYMEEMRHLQQEHLYAMFLNTKNALIRDALISKGTVNASLASPREIFIEAMRCQAVGLILVHNHPSGDSTPSREDCLMTRKVCEAGNLVDIRLLDHVVIGDNNYCSFKKEGML